jgi:hypothetical protein
VTSGPRTPASQALGTPRGHLALWDSSPTPLGGASTQSLHPGPALQTDGREHQTGSHRAQPPPRALHLSIHQHIVDAHISPLSGCPTEDPSSLFSIGLPSWWVSDKKQKTLAPRSCPSWLLALPLPPSIPISFHPMHRRPTRRCPHHHRRQQHNRSTNFRPLRHQRRSGSTSFFSFSFYPLHTVYG